MHQTFSANTHLSRGQPYLWGDVVWGATEGACGNSFCHVLFTHAKVSNLDVPFTVQHHIVQLQIPAEDIQRILEDDDFSLRVRVSRWLSPLILLSPVFTISVPNKPRPLAA